MGYAIYVDDGDNRVMETGVIYAFNEHYVNITGKKLREILDENLFKDTEATLIKILKRR